MLWLKERGNRMIKWTGNDEIDNKRMSVAAVYPNETWAEKVNDMTDEQIIAIFLYFKRTGKL